MPLEIAWVAWLGGRCSRGDSPKTVTSGALRLAASARRLGALLLRDAMSRCGELDLASYDRLFPNQDFLPQKGFGNLIALPLQGRCREAGTTVFLDSSTFEPAPDQWALLSSIERLPPERLDALIAESDDVPVGQAAIVTHPGRTRERQLPAEIRCTFLPS